MSTRTPDRLDRQERTDEDREPANSKSKNLAFRLWVVLSVLMAPSGYGRRSTERMPTTLRNGKRNQSRRMSRRLMIQGVEVVQLHQVEDEALAGLLIERPLRDRRIQHQYFQIRKKMLQCILLGKPPRNERSNRWCSPSKARKLSFESLLYVDRLLCRVLMVHGCHYLYAFATNRVSQVWERVVFSKYA